MDIVNPNELWHTIILEGGNEVAGVILDYFEVEKVNSNEADGLLLYNCLPLYEVTNQNVIQIQTKNFFNKEISRIKPEIRPGLLKNKNFKKCKFAVFVLRQKSRSKEATIFNLKLEDCIVEYFQIRKIIFESLVFDNLTVNSDCDFGDCHFHNTLLRLNLDKSLYLIGCKFLNTQLKVNYVSEIPVRFEYGGSRYPEYIDRSVVKITDSDLRDLQIQTLPLVKFSEVVKPHNGGRLISGEHLVTNYTIYVLENKIDELSNPFHFGWWIAFDQFRLYSDFERTERCAPYFVTDSKIVYDAYSEVKDTIGDCKMLCLHESTISENLFIDLKLLVGEVVSPELTLNLGKRSFINCSLIFNYTSPLAKVEMKESLFENSDLYIQAKSQIINGENTSFIKTHTAFGFWGVLNVWGKFLDFLESALGKIVFSPEAKIADFESFKESTTMLSDLLRENNESHLFTSSFEESYFEGGKLSLITDDIPKGFAGRGYRVEVNPVKLEKDAYDNDVFEEYRDWFYAETDVIDFLCKNLGTISFSKSRFEDMEIDVRFVALCDFSSCEFVDCYFDRIVRYRSTFGFKGCSFKDAYFKNCTFDFTKELTETQMFFHFCSFNSATFENCFMKTLSGDIPIDPNDFDVFIHCDISDTKVIRK